MYDITKLKSYTFAMKFNPSDNENESHEKYGQINITFIFIG